MRLHFLGFVEDSGPYDGGGCVWSFLEKKGVVIYTFSGANPGGDDFDWNIDDELEIENYNSSSSCLTLPNGDAGEFTNKYCSDEYPGEENEDKLLEELLSYKVKSENNAKKASKYLALHLIFEIDMIAHSLCEFAGGEEERKELEAYREIHVPTLSLLKWTTKLRSEGLCPLTPEESILMLGALGFNRKMHIFVVGFNLYGGGSQLVALTNLYPKLVTKENLLSSAELESFANYSSQLAALDFIGCTASDAFAMTNSGSQLSSLSYSMQPFQVNRETTLSSHVHFCHFNPKNFTDYSLFISDLPISQPQKKTKLTNCL
ncbi:hypothetical protein JHK86_001194 [Glycine max]|nr:hypothetical protein JHK86_001194 [Glycine max]